ncbi:metallophosphoesterase [Acanthopleuribacter pedis]|uniref:Metallophosphoesterase n=1 Tax=Acanthopleuribacter pedis TaxID=442870 RepID=A0A8J7U4M8_9BACT|nr:metallophosphoesterase [Acanthopleuribacter pedis]
MQKDWLIVGDVHGCRAELDALLAKAEFRPEQTELIFVGDLINKGPDSEGVLERAVAYNARMVLGNHETNFLEQARAGTFRPGSMSRVAEQMGPRLGKWVDYLERQPFWLIRPQLLVVHAGLHPSLALEDTPPRILTRIRTWGENGLFMDREQDPPWYHFYQGDATVVYGHWARAGLVMRERTIGLDSGCVYGFQLSALRWPQRELIQVNAFETYVQVPLD